MQNNIKDYMIIGYSLEATLVARKMANLGHKVRFVKSGILGHPCDDLNDYLTSNNYKKVIDTEVYFDVEKIVAGQYVHIPYENLKMVSNLNGLVSYPLNRSSFGTASEWEEMELRIRQMDEFFEVLSESNNYINLYKKYFPKWLYDSVLRHLGVNKWHMKQSQFTKDDLSKLFSIHNLITDEPEVMYRPVNGYEELCNEILDHDNIIIDNGNVSEFNDVLISRTRNTLVVFVDNRIDQICNYSMGMFERINFIINELTDDEADKMDELKCMDKGIAYTPMQEYWGIVKNDNGVRIFFSEIDNGTNSDIQNMILPSQSNLKIFNEYVKLFKNYPNKKFILPTPMTILR